MPRSSRTAVASPARPQLEIRRLDELTSEEKEVARLLAAEFNRITTLIASEGGRHDVDLGAPESSLAAQLRTHWLQLEPSARQRVQAHAVRAATAAPATSATPSRSSTRRVTAAASSSRRVTRVSRQTARPVVGARAAQADPFEISASLKTRLRRAAAARLEAQRAPMRRAIDAFAPARPTRSAERLPQTTVSLKLAGEVDSMWRRQINMAWPEMLDFKWDTKETGASRAYWELRGPVTPNHPGQVIASGYLPDAASEEGIGGYFTIPLRNHLPPTAPQTATTYHVCVLPLGPSRRVATQAARGRTPLRPVGEVEPAAPTGIGAWSAPAVINYGRAFEGPITPFDIEPITVYRKVKFFLDWFRLVEDQAGPGDEEYHIAGFVMQHAPGATSVPVHIGPYSFTVDPDDRSRHRFGRQAVFHLPASVNIDYWPRTFTAILSIMEEDDGGAMNDWHASIAEIASEMMHGLLAADLQEFMEEMREAIREKQQEMAAEAAAEMASLIVTMITAAAREVISAFIAAVVAFIIAMIRAGAGDDFYGTQMFGLALVTNDVKRIKRGGTDAGDIYVSRITATGARFEGTEQPDGSFRFHQVELQYRGLASAEEASPSGIVNLGVHWELSDKYNL